MDTTGSTMATQQSQLLSAIDLGANAGPSGPSSWTQVTSVSQIQTAFQSIAKNLVVINKLRLDAHQQCTRLSWLARPYSWLSLCLYPLTCLLLPGLTLFVIPRLATLLELPLTLSRIKTRSFHIRLRFRSRIPATLSGRARAAVAAHHGGGLLISQPTILSASPPWTGGDLIWHDPPPSPPGGAPYVTVTVHCTATIPAAITFGGAQLGHDSINFVRSYSYPLLKGTFVAVEPVNAAAAQPPPKRRPLRPPPKPPP